MEASSTLVVLESGATGGSASIKPDNMAPPKQKSMELNQHANGLRWATSNTPASQDYDSYKHVIISLHLSSFFLLSLLTIDKTVGI